mmetsp:Transcript_34342/g.47856  ORF Transcript_34342/g.47856 Transcript_34342/m.47856 type:complete len:92 (+) Transcript_34342:148-423(+)
MHECIHKTSHQIHCDDVTPCKLFVPERWENVLNEVQTDLNEMTEWCHKWRMKFNNEKSGCMTAKRSWLVNDNQCVHSLYYLFLVVGNSVST